VSLPFTVGDYRHALEWPQVLWHAQHYQEKQLIRSQSTETLPISRMRCAIYTRKSTEENLDTDFNSLDAQREAAEAYIASRARKAESPWLIEMSDGVVVVGLVFPVKERLQTAHVADILTDIAAKTEE
jgi:hypothetical protein